MGAIYFHTPCPPSPSPHPPSPPPPTSRNAIYINQPTKPSFPLIHLYIIIALPLTIQLLLQAIPSLKSTKEDLNHIHLPHIQKQASIPTHDPKAQNPRTYPQSPLHPSIPCTQSPPTSFPSHNPNPYISHIQSTINMPSHSSTRLH